MQSGKWQVVAPRAVPAPCSEKGSSALFREGIQPDKGPPKLRGVGGSDQGMRGLYGEKPQACVPLEGAEGACRAPESLEEGACGGTEGAPWGLGCVPYQEPTGTQFLSGSIYYKDTRKAHSRQTRKGGMWADWRKELTGVPLESPPTLSALSCPSARFSSLSFSPPPLAPGSFLCLLSPQQTVAGPCPESQSSGSSHRQRPSAACGSSC